MAEDNRFEAFMASITQRPLPTHPMARIRTLAKELAEGATQGLWGVIISTFRGVINEETVHNYLAQRWDGKAPHLGLLIANGYLTTDTSTNEIYLTRTAFDLLDEIEASSIFISYRRGDSSAFALLVLARLKAAGLDAFLDLTIQPGDNWRTHLQDQIKKRQYLILLLGPQTLSSDVVRQEVQWALEGGLTVIPIWHGGFKYQAGQWPVSPQMDNVLQNTHTIRVLEESALAYNNAIIELLNFFGVTP
jgi:hypothetical protein